MAHKIQLRYFTFSRRTLSIQKLLSLRAAGRRRDGNCTSRPGGRTTAGWWAVALAAPALAALALAWSLQPLWHDDLFWHLRTGEWIAAHHRVPLADLFSYTRPGARWITHEWGFSLLAWLVWRAAGAGGLVLLGAALALAVFAAVGWRALDLAGAAGDPPGGGPDAAGSDAAGSDAAGPDAAGSDAAGPGAVRPAHFLLLAALLGLGMWAAAPEIFLRAALAGELLLALSLAALTRYRRTGRRRWLLVQAPLFLVWANLHSGVVFGLYLLALAALDPWVRRGWRAAAPYLATLGAALALVLANPNGLDAPLYPFLLGRILFASGIPWELGHFTAAAPAGPSAALWLLLVLLLLALLPARQVRRLPLFEAAAIASFSLLALRSHRFVFDLVVIGLPALYVLLVTPPPPAGGQAAPGGLSRRLGLAGRPAAAAVLAALVLLPAAPAVVAAAAAGWLRRPPAAGGLIAEPFPAAALRFVVAQGIAGPADRIFNHQNYGGFIGWRLRSPVFWDGRNDVFAELVREVAENPFGVTAGRWGVDWLLITEHELPGIQPEIAAGRWGLVYWDDFCAVYLRRGSRYAAQLALLEAHLFPPFGGRPGLAALAADPAGAAAARAELGRLLAANPENQRALYFSGTISLYRGELRAAAADLGAARRIRPSEEVDRALALLRRLAQLAPHAPPPAQAP
jgi:hypothetical protein